ncbi:hypothetical protein B0J12DRAFT_651251 [Macrophomina phaseolina]|uniref:Secreted protein n=1 Tax=Macrophomina phaseolina TaxID=35725 RepID=A0ABQ8GK23_9PEZI|nr:hypothetical protein B0J12DRAFT_651251 [Macrophomina phaseolina]
MQGMWRHAYGTCLLVLVWVCVWKWLGGKAGVGAQGRRGGCRRDVGGAGAAEVLVDVGRLKGSYCGEEVEYGGKVGVGEVVRGVVGRVVLSLCSSRTVFS